ncbi:YciI family protein [Actinosynnema pretiosum]|uniref:YCII-related domain-containing protein n=1 Tax=Actinosynnema pretiosum TaxID=42197 RepID=A0A290Z323_9PSEU|nr:YciI family protein [Actinosynnema pretiosum]ATE53441.1 hypothetical protein CNX65_09145 [Actinosynnema pretiosum]
MAKFLLLMNYGATATCDTPMPEWDPADVAAHIAFQRRFGGELAARGELVDAQGLAQAAKVVVATGDGAPVVADGPFPEGGELIAGYWVVDVGSEARALEIAALASAAPGPGGVPLGQPIQVRAVLDAPEPQDV